MTAYYNEFDKNAVGWLRNLIAEGLIAPGIVDDRSILDVTPGDLRGFTQCHFFAGIGGWSLALRLAGWPDDRPVWTGSCPCQPFSTAGKGAGFADERHLWPYFDYLIRERKPVTVFGEQVASKDALEWLDLVQTDLEAKGYAFAPLDTCAAGFGAPHVRQRLYWVAHAERQQHQECLSGCREGYRPERGGQAIEPAGLCLSSRMDDPDDEGLERLGSGYQAEGGRVGAVRPVTEASELSRLGDAFNPTREWDSGSVFRAQETEHGSRLSVHGGEPIRPQYASAGLGERPGPTNGFWADADWLLCRDGKWRPVEPGTFPLAHGVPGRVGRLRAYGNAINPRQGAEFVMAFLDYKALEAML